MFGWGVGKPKSKLGKWLAQNGYTISELSKVSKVNRNTLGKACSDDDYIPSPQTMKKILKAIRQKDASAKMQDFWDM